MGDKPPHQLNRYNKGSVRCFINLIFHTVLNVNEKMTVYRLFAGVDLAVMPCVVYHLHPAYNWEGRLRRGSMPRDRWQRFGSYGCFFFFS
jgi:hypothetical protein